MAAGPNYAGTSTVGVALLQVGDNSRLNPSNALTIFTPANSQGAQVERILEEAVGACTNTAIRIYRNDGTTNHLYMEIQTASGSSSTGTAIIPQQQEAVDNSNLFPIAVPNGWTLTASINDTQIAAEMSINSVALAQTTAGAAQLSLSGALA